MSKSILVSIHPIHVENILSGNKVFEYRRVVPIHKINNMVIYSTKPVNKIVAVAEVSDYIQGSLDDVWRKTKKGSGISSDYYYSYFTNKTIASALSIEKVRRLSCYINLSDLSRPIKAPQSFLYLNEIDLSIITKYY